MRRFLLSTMVAIAALMPGWAGAADEGDAKRIADGLRNSGQLKDFSIGVSFEDGTAYLMGRVASEEQAETAVELAKAMPNVTGVVNNLEIKPSAKKDFDVQPTSHSGNSSRRTMHRDDMVFGAAEQSSVPQARQSASSIPVETAAAPQQARRVSHSGPVSHAGGVAMQAGAPIPVGASAYGNMQRVAYDQPSMPCYSWPSYASYPNYGAVTYPQQYSASAWPYIGPFYPYPQVPLGWRRVALEWKDGWWWLDFDDCLRRRCP